MNNLRPPDTCFLRVALSLLLALGGIVCASGEDSTKNLWALGRRHQDVHRLSTLFTAHDVKNHLSKDEGIGQAIDWCQRTAVTKVFIDTFHERGYDVARETADFDRIWVGTETRDYADPKWGGTVQYEAYFIMRWLGGIGGTKCGGGWYDWLGTTERTYVEQARQTVLAGARESLLFCYGGLQGTTGPKNIEALRANIPELLDVAKEVRRREVVGIAAYKPPNSHPEIEPRVFDFVGMLGLPLVPCHEFPVKAPAAFFAMHALKDPEFTTELSKFIGAGKPVLLTDDLVHQLANKVKLDAPNVHVLPVKGDPKSLLQLTQRELDELRGPLLRPFKAVFKAPNQVALYLFRDGSWVVENFTDEAITAELNGQVVSMAARGWQYRWKQ